MCEMKIVENKIHFPALLIYVNIFRWCWIHHKGLRSNVKASVGARSLQSCQLQLVNAAGTSLGRRNLDNSVLCSVILGVSGGSEFGRSALLFRSAGKLCIPSECPKGFNHVPHETCFMYFFRTKCVCMHVSTCRIIPLSVKPFGICAVSPTMQIVEQLNDYLIAAVSVACLWWLFWQSSLSVLVAYISRATRMRWDHISFPTMGEVSCGDCEFCELFLDLLLFICSALGFT